MNDPDIRSFEMLLRVSAFGNEQAAAFPAGSLGAELFAKIKAAGTALDSHIAQQVSGSTSAKQGTSSKGVAREALHKSMERLRRTARAMAVTNPGVENKFRIPRGVSDQELLGAAQAFATDALPLKTEFIRHAMPADFLDDLNDQITEFRNALTAQQTGKGNQIMATAAIDNTLDEALSAVRQLDPIVRNTFQDDPARLAAWLSARHVERAPRRKKTEPTVSAQP